MTDWKNLYEQNETVWGEKPDYLLMDIAPSIPQGKVLDLGMGEGRNALFFARQGYDVKGIDVSAAAVQHCLERAKALQIPIQAEAANMLDVENEPDSLALVISTMALQFMKQSESAQVLRNTQRWLQPGGMVYLTMFSTEEPGLARMKESHTEIEPNTFYSERFGSHVHYFAKDELLGLFSDFKLHYFAQALQLDGGHPGAPEPHYHGIITYMGQKKN
jgi:cyclopropane fatty-acyl-phospholipid synthase-like methyltransferase